jgi:glycosyltransferase involved in cell wall biosynthesis
MVKKNIVSVFILTYNQEKFISQTLESILSQKTNFNYQLVIGEDHSTDSTRLICEKFAAENPLKIKLLPSLGQNIGLIKNYIRTIKECDGKYIAICDGDDYWIDDYKLQKQVDFLESNPHYSIVYSKIELLFKNGTKKIWSPIIKKNNTQFEDLIFNNHIPSVSSMFKNIQNENDKIPEWILKYPFGDWPTYLWTIKNEGQIYYLDEVTAVYRIDAGISTEMRRINSKMVKINLNILQDIFEDNQFSHKKQIVAEAIVNLRKGLVSRYNREFKYHKGFIQFLKNASNTGFKLVDLKMYFYSIYKSLR